MLKNKSLIALIMVLAVLALQVGAAYAAPAAQSADVTGTVQSITQSTDSSGNTIFVVKLVDSSGNTQTVNLTPAQAVNLGLVTESNGTYTINTSAIGTTVTITGTTGTANPCSEKEQGLVASAISAFFCQGSSTVLDKSVNALHSEGFGFGEIAQACFMADILQTTCGDILSAKQSHDFSALGLPSDVTNWGQLRKYALGQEVKSLTNLGAIMSGRAQAPSANGTPAPTPMGPLGPGMSGNGHGHGNGGQGGNGHGNGNGHGHKP